MKRVFNVATSAMTTYASADRRSYYHSNDPYRRNRPITIFAFEQATTRYIFMRVNETKGRSKRYSSQAFRLSHVKSRNKLHLVECWVKLNAKNVGSLLSEILGIVDPLLNLETLVNCISFILAQPSELLSLIITGYD